MESDPTAIQLIKDEKLFEQFKKGIDLFREKKFDEALLEFNQLETLAPQFCGIWYFKGEIAFEQKRYTDAYQLFERVYRKVGDADYHQCISKLCFMISKNIVPKPYTELLELYKVSKSVRFLFLLLEQLNKRLLGNQLLYCTVYAPVIKKLMSESSNTFLALFSRLLYDQTVFRASLQWKGGEDKDDGYQKYLTRLELLTDIPVSYKEQEGFVRLFSEIIYLQNNVNHTVFSYFRHDNLQLYKKVSAGYRELFTSLNFVADHVDKKEEKIYLNLFIVCKRMLYDSPILYRWYNHILSLMEQKQIKVSLVCDRSEESPLARVLASKVKHIYDSSEHSFEYLIKGMAHVKPDIILYLDLGKCISDYMLAHCRLAPIQISFTEFPEQLGINTIDYYVWSKELGRFPSGNENIIELDSYPYSIIKRGVVTDDVEVKPLIFPCMEVFDTDFYKWLNPVVGDWKVFGFRSGCPEYDRSLEKLVEKIGLKMDLLPTPPSVNMYYDVLNRMRIGVDCYPNSNLGIAFDLLSIGKPVVTMVEKINGEETLRSPYVATLLRHSGLTELVVDSKEQYTSLVNRLMSDDTFYSEICQKVKSTPFEDVNRVESRKFIDELKGKLMTKVCNKITIVDKRGTFFKVLGEIKGVMGRIGCEYFIAAGTLLGWYRENNVLEHDKDIDIGVYKEEFDRIGGLDRLVEPFVDAGFEFVFALGAEEEGLQVSFVKDEVGLDIFVYYRYGESDEGVRSLDCYYRYVKRMRFLYRKFNLKQISFLSETMLAPDPPVQHILDDYGEGWSKPDPGYCWFTQPNVVFPFGSGIISNVGNDEGEDRSGSDDSDGELEWKQVCNCLITRVYKKITIFVLEGVNKEEVLDYFLECNWKGEVEVIAHDAIQLERELAWRVYSHPLEFSCFVSNCVQKGEIPLVGYDMAYFEMNDIGYGCIGDSSVEGLSGLQIEKVEKKRVGIEIDWDLFSELPMDQLLTVPRVYSMYGGFFFKMIANKMIEQFRLSKDSQVCEIGCGVGAIAQHLDCQYTGVDSSQKMLDRHIELNERSEVVCRDGGDTGLKSEKYDLCFIWESMRYFEDLEKFDEVIREMERLVKKGGVLFLGDVKEGMWPKDYFMFTGWSLIELNVQCPGTLNLVKW